MQSVLLYLSDRNLLFQGGVGRGTGIGERGGLIARMDADDVALSNRLEVQLSFLNAHKDVVLVGTHATVIDEADSIIDSYLYPPREHQDICSFLRRGNPIIHPSVMFRKSAFDKIGGYRKFHNAEDYELWTRMIKVGRLANIAEKLLLYRVHGASVTRKKHVKMRFTALLVRLLAHVRTLT